MAQLRSLEYVKIDEVKRFPGNPKSHDEETLGASMSRFGFAEPGVVDERTGKLLSGHGRLSKLLAMKRAGEEAPDGILVNRDGSWSMPLVRGLSSKSDREAKALVVALNRISESGGWDDGKLAKMLAAVGDDLLGVGFDDDDLSDLRTRIEEAAKGDNAYDETVSSKAEGAHAESTYEGRGENYRNKQVRSVIFDYPLSDYAEVSRIAGRARVSFGVETNAELLLAMLRSWETEHPEPE